MKTPLTRILLSGITGLLIYAGFAAAQSSASRTPKGETMNTTETAIFATGCFWCTEEIFRQQKGVSEVISGYIGGTVADPSYKQICSGTTGHAEAIQVTFDPEATSYGTLLDLFWKAHDPTQLNRQGADVGTQYRSAIFVLTPEQRSAAEASKKAADRSGYFKKPIVTEITDAPTFYTAEASHQDYYVNNKRAPYCRAVIRPKLKKLGLEN
jgi:peptide-methionine (S)-S-oxide reductase